MPGQFTCPHCNTVLPILPSLVGRRMRCNTCRQPFVLHKNGHATTAADALAQHNAAPAQQQAEVDERIEFLTQSWSESATATLSQRDAGEARPVRARVTSRREAARASMRANLQQAAEQALSALPSNAGTSTVKAASEAQLKVEASLSGSGAKASSMRRFALLIIGATLTMLALVVTLWPAAPAYRSAFQRDMGTPALVQTADGFHASILLGDAGAVRFGPVEAVALQDAFDRVAYTIAGMRRSGPCFVAAQQADAFAGALRTAPPGRLQGSIDAIRAQHQLTLVTCAELADLLERSVADSSVRQVLDLIIAGDNELLAELQAGTFGNDQELVTLRGTGATQLLAQGDIRRSVPLADWHGWMLRRGDGPWQVLHLAPGADSAGTDESPLRRRWDRFAQEHLRRSVSEP